MINYKQVFFVCFLPVSFSRGFTLLTHSNFPTAAQILFSSAARPSRILCNLSPPPAQTSCVVTSLITLSKSASPLLSCTLPHAHSLSSLQPGAGKSYQPLPWERAGDTSLITHTNPLLTVPSLISQDHKTLTHTEASAPTPHTHGRTCRHTHTHLQRYKPYKIQKV